MLSDINRNVLAIQEGTDGQHRSVSTTLYYTFNNNTD